MTKKSEFGRGYATCLLMFSFHEARIDEYIRDYAQVRGNDPDNASYFTESRAIELWANGASDHLSELVKPKRGLTIVQWRLAKALAEKWLDIGHGFRGNTATADEARKAVRLARRLAAPATTYTEAWALDLGYGLKPDQGSWGCSEPMMRKP